jgi:hypothetical protein
MVGSGMGKREEMGVRDGEKGGKGVDHYDHPSAPSRYFRKAGIVAMSGPWISTDGRR